jgi:flagellar assembly protein FliH
MAQNGFTSSSDSSQDAAQNNAPPVSRLEYRQPGASAARKPVQNGNGHAATQPASSSAPTVEPWQYVAQPTDGTAPAPEAPAMDGAAAAIYEQQLQQERAQYEQRLAAQAAESSRAIALASEAGRREGRQAAAAELEQERAQLRQHIAQALEAFRQQRERYFHSVEREVVRLSLAVAARILHRQAQMDPLFLAGAVRVALEKLSDTTGVTVRVAPAQVLAWQEMFRLHGGARMQPEVLGDLNLNAGECILETRLGTVELGVKAQLEEIEKGFFDLLHHHPTAPERRLERNADRTMSRGPERAAASTGAGGKGATSAA